MGNSGTVSDFILGGSKITADGDCSHEIKRHLLLGRKAVINIRQIPSLHFLCYMLMLPSENIEDSDCMGLSPPALPGVLLELLEAAQDPKKVLVIHCKRHQKGNLQYQEVTWLTRQ